MRLDMTERDRFLPEVDFGDALRNLKQKLWHRWQLIAAFVVVAVVLAVLFVLTAAPKYTANASLLIDPRTGQNPEGTGQISPGLLMSDGLTVDSELRILASREVTTRTVRSLGLDQAEEATETETSPSGPQWLRTWLQGEAKETSETDTPSLSADLQEQRRLEILRKNFIRGLEIRRSGESYVIDLEYTSPDLQFAAEAINTLISEYLNLSREQHTAGLERNRNWLESRIAELGAGVARAESAVATFREDNNLLSPEGSLLPTEVALNSAIEELVRWSGQALALDVQIQQLGEQIATGDLDAPQVLMEDRTKALDEFEASYASMLQQEQLLNRDKDSAVAKNLRSRLEQQKQLILSEYVLIKERLQTRSSALHRQIDATKTVIEQLREEYAIDAQNLVQVRGLEREANAKRQLYERLLEQYNSTSQLVSFDATSARVIAWAVPPDRKSSPKSKQIVILAVFAALVLAVGTIFIIDALDNSFRDRQDIAQELGLNFLGISPKFGTDRTSHGKVKPDSWTPLYNRSDTLGQMNERAQWFDFAAANPMSIQAEAMRSIHVALRMKKSKPTTEAGGIVIGLVSSVRNEGKTNTALNLATYLASRGERTVFVDMDLATYEATQLLHPAVSGTNRLSTLLRDPDQAMNQLVPVPRTPNLTLIGNFGEISRPGPDHSETIHQALTKLRDQYDYVVVDLPPLLGVAETQFLANLCDKLIYIIKWGGTPRPQVHAAMKRIADAKKRILGVVFTQVDLKTYDNANPNESYY